MDLWTLKSMKKEEKQVLMTYESCGQFLTTLPAHTHIGKHTHTHTRNWKSLHNLIESNTYASSSQQGVGYIQ